MLLRAKAGEVELHSHGAVHVNALQADVLNLEKEQKRMWEEIVGHTQRTGRGLLLGLQPQGRLSVLSAPVRRGQPGAEVSATERGLEIFTASHSPDPGRVTGLSLQTAFTFQTIFDEFME